MVASALNACTLFVLAIIPYQENNYLHSMYTVLGLTSNPEMI